MCVCFFLISQSVKVVLTTLTEIKLQIKICNCKITAKINDFIYPIRSSHMYNTKSLLVSAIFDLIFDKDQMCSKSNFSCRYSTGILSMNICIQSVDSYLKRKYFCVFYRLHGNVCAPFENYFIRANHNFNAKNSLSSFEFPKMRLEFSSQSIPLEVRNWKSSIIEAKGERTFYL